MENTERQKNLEGFCLHFKQYYTQTHTHTLNLLWHISRFPCPSVIIRWNPCLKLWHTFLGYQSICLAFCISWKELRQQDLKHVKTNKKKTTYTRTNFEINPRAPKPLPSILSGPLSCASEKMCDEKGQTKKRNDRQEEQRLKRIRGKVQGEIQQPRCGGETCDVAVVAFLFFQHTD